MSDDQHFLQQVRASLSSARSHIEEAASYAEAIEDPRLKKQAEQLIDDFPETLP